MGVAAVLSALLLVARAAVGCCAASDQLRLATVSDVQLSFRYVQCSISLLLALSADRVTYGTDVDTSKKQKQAVRSTS